jgi:predicted CoA-binding protein
MSEACEFPLHNASPAEIRTLLEGVHTIAVVGLSDNPERASHGVAAYLQRHGYRIIPVNPNVAEVLGERAYGSLRDIPDKVDLVDVFRRPEHVPAIVEDAIAIGARAVWMQEGVVHNAAAERARAAGLAVVMDRCIFKEHRRAGL